MINMELDNIKKLGGLFKKNDIQWVEFYKE